MDRFRANLQAFREQRGLTQKALSEILGVENTTISKIERGVNHPTWELLLRIAEEFQPLDMNFFFRKSVSSFYDGSGRESFRREGDEITMLPIISQAVAAGSGISLVENAEVIGELPVLHRLIAAYPRDNLRVVEVRGDSMTGINLFDGDYAVFVQGLVRDSGIYVLTLDGAVLIKRIEYDRIAHKVLIYSENPRYQSPKEIEDTNDLLRIEGKVVAWFHNHPY